MAEEWEIDGRKVSLIRVVGTRSMVREGGKLLGMVTTTGIFAQGWTAEIKRDGKWERIAEKLGDEREAIKVLLAIEPKGA